MTLQFAQRLPVKSTEIPSDKVLPLSELTETQDGFELQVEMPGVARENMDITVENGFLRLTGKRPNPVVGTALIRELSSGDYAREFRLGSTIDPSRISASVDQGVLRLHLPKSPQAQPRHIALEV